MLQAPPLFPWQTMASSTILADLRGQLTVQLGALWLVVSSIAAWLSLIQRPFPQTFFFHAALLLTLTVIVLLLASSHRKLARHLFAWGMVLLFNLAIWLFSAPWLPFAAILVLLMATALLPGSDIVALASVLLLTGWLTYAGHRSYPLLELSVVLGVGLVIGWLVVFTLYVTINWTHTMQRQADNLLSEVRSHRADLARALSSYEVANSRLRRAEWELIQARDQADEARQMKEQFAANISHELRTPLNLILGFSELMYHTPEVYSNMEWPSTLRQDVYQIYRSSRHLLEMVDDILILSRFEVTGFALRLEATHLVDLLDDAISIGRDLFRTSAAQLVVSIEPNLPILEIDRTRIRQVLLNLLNNAYRFTETGTVRLTAFVQEDEVVITVSDTGPGIPAAKLTHIFEEFYQADLSIRRSYQGAGLGLAICKHFVEAHQGHIWVESEVNKGSTFFFSLPIPGEKMPLSTLNQNRLERIGTEERPSILVVDPDPSITALFCRYLSNYEVVQVPNEETLPATVNSHHPRVVVYNRPTLEGSGIGELSLPAPVLECSLPSQTWLREHLSVAASLTKPITSEQLLATVASFPHVHDLLVIDDDRGFCQLVTRILASQPEIHVRRAYDGLEGWSNMKAQRPDLVLMDLGMEEMDGYTLLGKIQESEELRDIPIVLITARSFPQEATFPKTGEILLRRSGGFSQVEILQAVKSLADVLEPQYGKQEKLSHPLVAHTR